MNETLKFFIAYYKCYSDVKPTVPISRPIMCRYDDILEKYCRYDDNVNSPTPLLHLVNNFRTVIFTSVSRWQFYRERGYAQYNVCYKFN